MPRKINDKCIACGSCASVCPMGAIKLEGDKYEIDPEICINCGLCETVCPVGAISEETK